MSLNTNFNNNEQPMQEEDGPAVSITRRKRDKSPTPSARAFSYPTTKEDRKLAIASIQQNEEVASNPYAHKKGIMGCLHEETETINGVIECLDCGQHLEDVMDQEQEWRYYGDNDNKNSSDPSRCQFRKTQEKGIRKDLERMNLPAQVINLADRYYHEVTQGVIKRGNIRKGILFACVFEAYNEIDKHQLPDQLRNLFCIDKRSGNRGETYFARNIKNRKREYTTALHLIPKICEKFNQTYALQLDNGGIQEVRDLYSTLKGKNPKLDHSYPQSVASGCVYYVLKRKNVDISSEEFGKIVGLSGLTVSKKANEIEEILSIE